MRSLELRFLAAPAAAAALALLPAACNDSTTTPPASASGSVVVDVEPNDITATWHLAGPDGATHDAAGDATLSDLPVGAYTLTWGDAAGYTAPVVASQNLTGGATLTFTGVYQVPGMIFPDTPDKLMANFQAMYETMNVAALGSLLHPDHITILQQSTINYFPDVGPTLDTTEERRIHERMFGRAAVTDPDGSLVPGVQSISFQTFARQGSWLETLPTDAIPGFEAALYDVRIQLDRGGLYSRLKTQGVVKFYVTHRDSVVDGTPRPFYRLRGQLDLTDDTKAASEENVAWGSVKALFR